MKLKFENIIRKMYKSNNKTTKIPNSGKNNIRSILITFRITEKKSYGTYKRVIKEIVNTSKNSKDLAKKTGSRKIAGEHQEKKFNLKIVIRGLKKKTRGQILNKHISMRVKIKLNLIVSKDH